MPAAGLGDDDVAALVAYIQSLGNATPAAPEQKAQR
jgi:mono/diheme cytochrome c family protein